MVWGSRTSSIGAGGAASRVDSARSSASAPRSWARSSCHTPRRAHTAAAARSTTSRTSIRGWTAARTSEVGRRGSTPRTLPVAPGRPRRPGRPGRPGPVRGPRGCDENDGARSRSIHARRAGAPATRPRRRGRMTRGVSMTTQTTAAADPVAWSRRPDEPLTDETLARVDAWWRAANYLSVGQIYLLDNPLLREPLTTRPRQAAPARPLGHDARAELPLRAPQPRDPRAAAVDPLRHRPRPRRPRPGRERLPRRHLLRDLLGHHPGRRGPAPAVPAVLLPRRHPQPRRARDPRVDPRGRRARATRCRTPTARRSTTRTCSSPR